MRAGARRLAAAVAVSAAFGVGGSAQAQSPTIVVENGKTAPAFGYADAVRERVFIPLPGVDQDSDGQPDRTAIELMRPKATNEGLKAPAIIDPSPYYTTLGRGHEPKVALGQQQVIVAPKATQHRQAGGLLDRLGHHLGVALAAKVVQNNAREPHFRIEPQKA